MMTPPSPSKQRRIIHAIGLITALLGLMLGAACRRPPPTDTPAAPLRIAMDKWAGYYPLVLADSLGFLREENVSITLNLPEDTHHMIADFAANKYDGIFVSLSDVILTTRVQPAMRFILISDESAGGDQLLGPDELRDATQIVGKRVGTTLGGFGEIFIRRFLDRHGVSPDKITLVNADAATVPALLKQGAIDVGHTWEPYAGQARALGYHPWFTSKDTPGLILDGLIVSQSLIKERPIQVQGMVRAWFRAVEWWKDHQLEGDALLEKRLNLSAGSVSLEGVRLYDRAGNQQAFGLSGTSPGALYDSAREHVEFFTSRGQLVQRVKPENLIDSRFIR